MTGPRIRLRIRNNTILPSRGEGEQDPLQWPGFSQTRRHRPRLEQPQSPSAGGGRSSIHPLPPHKNQNRGQKIILRVLGL